MFIFWVTGYFTSGEAIEKCARSGNQILLLFCFEGKLVKTGASMRVRCSHVGRDSKIFCVAEGLMQAVLAHSGYKHLAFEHHTTLRTLCSEWP
jgi:hypothetical protein